MDKVVNNAHREVHAVDKECSTVEEFGRRYIYISGFRARLGYGHFEFTKEEKLKQHMNVIIMDKVLT